MFRQLAATNVDFICRPRRLTKVSEEPSLSSMQYSLVHRLHGRMYKALHGWHCKNTLRLVPIPNPRTRLMNSQFVRIRSSFVLCPSIKQRQPTLTPNLVIYHGRLHAIMEHARRIFGIISPDQPAAARSRLRVSPHGDSARRLPVLCPRIASCGLIVPIHPPSCGRRGTTRHIGPCVS
jgi:hypothetical protein